MLNEVNPPTSQSDTFTPKVVEPKKIPVVPRVGRFGTLDPDGIKGFDTPEDCAYAAGFFDGEGHVNIRLNTAPNKRQYKALHISIGQASRPVLEWFEAQYGGNIYEYRPKEGKKTFWQWSIVGTRARKFLSQVQPYLRVKQDQVVAVINEWESRHASK